MWRNGLGLNRTTAYRYCASLVTAGILERGHRRGTFVLGGLMVQLGMHALGRRRVVEIAPPYLAELSAAVRMTAVLGVWGARGPVVALVIEDISRILVVTVHAGTKLDLNSSQLRCSWPARTSRRSNWPRRASRTPGGPSWKRGSTCVRRNGFSITSTAAASSRWQRPSTTRRECAPRWRCSAGDQMADLSPGSPALDQLQSTRHHAQ